VSTEHIAGNMASSSSEVRERLLAQIRERIVRYAASHIGQSDSEGVAQEVLIVLHKKYPHLENAGDLVPVAFSTARYVIMGRRNKWRRRGESAISDSMKATIPDGTKSPEQKTIDLQFREHLLEAFREMDARCRRLFRLLLEGRKTAEIQGLMNAPSAQAVYNWNHRCRASLREILESKGAL